MNVFKIEYRLFPDEYVVVIVTANSAEEAIEKAGIQDAYMYHISKYLPYRLANKTYSRRHGTYNALWLDSEGNAAFWGSYNPDDGSFYLAKPGCTLASGMWVESWDGDFKFQHQGNYDYEYVRRAIQLGAL